MFYSMFFSKLLYFHIIITIICVLKFHNGVRTYKSNVITGNPSNPLKNARSSQFKRSLNPITRNDDTGMPNIPEDDLQAMINEAESRVKKRLEIIEPGILSSGAIQIPGSQGWFLAASSRTKILAKNYSNLALIAEEASKIIADSFQLNRDQINYGLPTTDVRATILGELCPRKEISFPCHPGKYRSFSGHCNNVQNPDWGTSVSAYSRFTPPFYADGISSPRHAISGDELPSPRDVSFMIHQGSEIEHPHITTLFALLGEFIFHDISHTAQTVGHRGHRIKCCGLKEDVIHPECYSIRIRRNDPLFREMKQSCFEYVRSCPAIRMGCTLGPREQFNQVTSFLDASTIYGSSEEESQLLRSFKDGLLKSQIFKHNNKQVELLPALDGQQDCRSLEEGRGKKCFYAGDIRVNENVGLTLMHTLWLREHNRIARELLKLNPHHDDEQIFQETRKIVGAEMQHIVYNELLPSILGQEKMSEYDLELINDGYYYGYDIDINPSIGNVIASSVFNFFYSMMPSKFERYSSKLSMVGAKKMSETYFNPSDLYDYSKLDEYLMGFINQNAHNPDIFVSDEMTNSIVPEAGEGFDLVSIILQQGRDHGIPGYTKWRKMCNIEPIINEWNDLEKTINITTAEKLSKIYRSVHDIDLFTGGLAEAPLRGGVVGPTFACILARQFHYLRKGDRYWYENDLPPSAFTLDQLKEIRKTSLASIICNNGDDISFVQPLVLMVSDPYLNAFQYCTNIPNMDLKPWKTESKFINLPESLIKETLDRSKRQLKKILEFENRSYNNRKGVASPKTPEGSHLGFQRPKREALSRSNQSLVLEIVSNNFIRSFLQKNKDREKGRSLKLEVKDLMNILPSIDLNDLIDNHFLDMKKNVPIECKEDFGPCDHTSPYRTANGWCNNLKNPDYGNSMKVFDRFLPSQYHDNVSVPRKRSVNGKLLPSPRLISTKMHYDISSPHLRYALVMMQWGQFLDHDLTLTPMYMGPNESILDCKSCDSAKTVHPECYPISIPSNDPYFPSVDDNGNKRCLHFARSINGQNKLGPREQINQLTAYIDASNVYGSDKCDADMLRTFVNGKLNSTVHPLRNHKELLPQTATNPECLAPSGLCFEAGDIRSSEQPALACMHTIFLRQHNRFAEKLADINPRWDDETIYQTTRKIIGAILQRITYNEFLPRVLGLDYMNKYDLTLLSSGYYTGYDENCKANIFNEFASAVFRFGHSLIKPSFERLGRSFRAVDDSLKLRHGFFNSDMLYSANAIDNILRGLVSNTIETLDNSVTKEITNHLFEDKNKPFSGMDLISLNIQRGRDHGLPPYNEFRVRCNLTRANKFQDLSKEISPNLIARLEKIYSDVNDIDLFTGGLSESPLHGGSVGPTFGCIVSSQFQRLKKCDRFWHESDNPFVRFTQPQLNEIRKMTLSKIICDNSDHINFIQRYAMDLPDAFLNPRVECSSLPSIDISKWLDRDGLCIINNKEVRSGKSERSSPCTMCICTEEGPVCNSIRVRNCFNLFSLFTREEILNDPVCKVQCAYALRMVPNERILKNGYS